MQIKVDWEKEDLEFSWVASNECELYTVVFEKVTWRECILGGGVKDLYPAVHRSGASLTSLCHLATDTHPPQGNEYTGKYYFRTQPALSLQMERYRIRPHIHSLLQSM